MRCRRRTKKTFVKLPPYDTQKIRLNERILGIDFVTVNLPPSTSTLTYPILYDRLYLQNPSQRLYLL